MSGRLSMLERLAQEAEVRPDDLVAIVDGAATLSYAELWARSGELAGGLREYGIRHGDLVAVVSPEDRWCEFLVACYGIYLSGAVALPVSEGRWRAGGAAAVHAAGARLVLSTTGSLSDVDDRLAVESSVGLRASVPDLILRPDPDATACVIQTSGTSGAPRLVAWSWANVDFDHAGPARPATASRNRFLTVPAIGSAVAQTMVHDSASGPLIIVSSTPDPSRLAGLVERFSPTGIGLVPPVAALLARQLREVDVDVSSVRFVVCGSAPLPVWLFQELGELFPTATIHNSYGLTEGGILINTLGEGPPGALGRPDSGVEVRIMGPNGTELGRNTTGAIWIRETGKPPRAGRSIVDGGWVNTGDRGHVDEDGFVHLAGRDDEIVVVAGMNVALLEVEAALAAHPAVDIAAVVPVPHDLLGHRLVGVVRAGEVVQSDELLRACNATLPAAARLHDVFIVDDLPLTPNRKLDRPAVANLVARSAATPPLPPAPPANGIEDLSLSAWRQALDRPDLRLDDNVVELGSHSLLAIEVAQSLGDALNHRVPVGLALSARTPRELASSLRRAVEGGQLERRHAVLRHV